MNLDILNKVTEQVENCYNKYGQYSGRHEFIAVLWEEFEELKAEIFKKEPDFKRIENEIVDCLTVLFKGYNDIVINKNKR